MGAISLDKLQLTLEAAYLFYGGWFSLPLGVGEVDGLSFFNSLSKCTTF